SLALYFATLNASDKTYDSVRNSLGVIYPDLQLFLHWQIKEWVGKIANIALITYDMCPNTCLAFTGPFSDLEKCPYPNCGASRWDPVCLKKGKLVVAQTFTTITLGLQLQALYSNPESASNMKYCWDKTKEI
ncbi:hypothetical protein P691DRAFT_648355, partial [Macrolepiota fuliginosa MF-IS2]